MFNWHELKQATDERHQRFIEEAARQRGQGQYEPQRHHSRLLAGVGQLLTVIKHGLKGFDASDDGMVIPPGRHSRPSKHSGHMTS